MDKSYDRALKQLMEMEDQKQSVPKATHVCYPAGSEKPHKFFVSTRSGHFLLIALGLVLLCSLMSAVYLFKEQKELSSVNLELNETISGLKTAADRRVKAELKVGFGRSSSDKGQMYYRFGDENSSKIIFTTGVPTFRTVATRNGGLYLYVSSSMDLSRNDWYLLMGYLLDKTPRMVFGSDLKAIVLNPDWIEWDKATFEKHLVRIPLKPNYNEFVNIVQNNSELELPQCVVEVE